LLNDGPVGVLQANSVAATATLQDQMKEFGQTGIGSSTTTIALPSTSNEINPMVENPKPQFYTEVLVTYAVLIRNSVKVLNTTVFARLPLHNKYVVENEIITSLCTSTNLRYVKL